MDVCDPVEATKKFVLVYPSTTPAKDTCAPNEATEYAHFACVCVYIASDFLCIPCQFRGWLKEKHNVNDKPCRILNLIFLLDFQNIVVISCVYCVIPGA